MTDKIDEFIAGWVEDGKKYYSEIKAHYIKFLKTGEDKNAYKNADELKRLFGNKKLGFEAGRLIRNAYYCKDEVCEIYTKYMENVLIKEAEYKKKQLESKIEKEVGEVKNANLVIGIDGGINGYIEGSKGKVDVTTIGAGGYNIQRYHYRVLINRIKD